MRCTACLKDIDRGVAPRFCNFCGAPVTWIEVEPTQPYLDPSGEPMPVIDLAASTESSRRSVIDELSALSSGVSVARADAVLRFWFGTGTDPWSCSPELTRMWFTKDAELDRRLELEFGADLDSACRGGCAHWNATARGRLAHVVLLDQFSRNIFRNHPNAFAQDALTRELVFEGIERGHDKQLRAIERAFFYLPLEHQESLADQELAVSLFEALAAEAPAEAGFLQASADYARRHHAIIARFGRFPHRNVTVGRFSTPEELAFLHEPGSSF